jgi:hypothetical protein
VLAHDDPASIVGFIWQSDVLAAFDHGERELDAPRVQRLRFARKLSASKKRTHKPA